MIIPNNVYDVLNYVMFNNCEEFGTQKCILRLPIILGDDFDSNIKSKEAKSRFITPDILKRSNINTNFEIMEILKYLKKRGIVKDIGDIIVYKDYWGRRNFEEGSEDTGEVIGNVNKPETLVDILSYNRDKYFGMDIRIDVDRYEAYEVLNDYNKYRALLDAIQNIDRY